ncbi:gallate 1-beta-glucosyltransferase 84A24-like [Solanum stenotomum]|uniref:gallate 1-beta-glucosyltransferase 84A24-like n=1 Tax=Solanum stenotomum TaxID=172797 RepID=UPI0020D10455|nr:gallate 1-beta-glucosyltransferase 84A24-like [Solanum stenotomum]
MASPSQNTKSSLVHIFLVSFPGQGNVNPFLRLAKRLASKGMLVTFSAPEHVGKEMRAVDVNLIIDQPTPYGDGMIRFEFFEDGPSNQSIIEDFDLRMKMLEQAGRRNLTKILKKQDDEGRPVSCIVNNPFFPWVCEIAESLGIPNALLWVQSCACFSIYYHYNFNLVPFPSELEPEKDVLLPNMPVLKYDDLPTFLLHSSGFESVLKRIMLDQFNILSKPFCILVDSFQELEEEVVRHMSKICPIRTIGPLLFNDPKIISTIRGDCTKIEEDCIEWLDSRPTSSVVYISFGSVAVPDQEQTDEIAFGLLNSGISFLWVMKPPPAYSVFQPVVLPDGFLSKVGGRGKIVTWCPQEQVLSHPSVAFFLTHCGWNSSMEAFSSGVPIMAYPQWGDQATNAKYLVDVFKMGIRLSRGENGSKIIAREEIEKCLREATSDDSKVAEMKENAHKWKKQAEEAVAERGSSAINIQAFVDELKNIHAKKQEENA